MTDIDIAGLECMRDRMTHMAADSRPAGLTIIPTIPETFPVNWVPFYRRDLDTLLAALRARDDRIAELEYEMQEAKDLLKEEQEERADEVKEAAKVLKAVEKERDEAFDCTQTLRGQLEDVRFDLANAQTRIHQLGGT